MQYRKLSDLHKLDSNPRYIAKDDFDKLCKSIESNKEFFEARPILLSNRTGKLVILGGNQRYEASKALNLKEVPTFLIEGLTEEQEREIIIRDNVNNGQWDYETLANEWDIEELNEWGLDFEWDSENVEEEEIQDNSFFTLKAETENKAKIRELEQFCKDNDIKCKVKA